MPRPPVGRRPRTAVLALVVLQLALPAVLLGVRWVDEGSRPVTELPASFQMYSARPPPTYVGVDAAGERRGLAVDGLPPVLRAVGTGDVVPARLCARDGELEVVERRGGPDPGAFPC